MATYTFDKLRSEYARLWRDMTVKPSKLKLADAVANKIIASKSRYLYIQNYTGVPWYVVGIIHAMECGLKFTGHLHNGDPLTARTVQVPDGRPLKGNPPFTWAESAIDALTMKNLHRVKDWTVERIAYVLETYNGFGYRNRGKENAYLWSYSNHYTSGKYIRDHVWSDSAISTQCGGMVLLKRLMALDSTIRLGATEKPVQPFPPPPDIPAPEPPTPAPAPVPAPTPAPEKKGWFKRTLEWIFGGGLGALGLTGLFNGIWTALDDPIVAAIVVGSFVGLFVLVYFTAVLPWLRRRKAR